MYKDHHIFIIERIQEINKRAETFKLSHNGQNGGWVPTRKVIYAGSYDVWETAQDQIDSMKLPAQHLNNARAEGFIDTVSGNTEWYRIFYSQSLLFDNWFDC
jgi:hypothetical protein